jgi:hypothetical protein
MGMMMMMMMTMRRMMMMTMRRMMMMMTMRRMMTTTKMMTMRMNEIENQKKKYNVKKHEHYPNNEIDKDSTDLNNDKKN